MTERGPESVELSRTTARDHAGAPRWLLLVRGSAGWHRLVLAGVLATSSPQPAPGRQPARSSRPGASWAGPVPRCFASHRRNSFLTRVRSVPRSLGENRIRGIASFGGQLCIAPASPSLEAPLRIKARDTFFGDLPAICLGSRRRTSTTSFSSITRACFMSRCTRWRHDRGHTGCLMPANEPVEEFNRRVRQAVFDRMSVQYLVSDRVETDPPWPVVAEGTSERRRRS